METFKSLFDKHAEQYAQYRPKYPDELYQFLVKQLRSHDLAWDCGTGSGQAAIALSKYFDRVVATDASELQLQNAEQRPNIEYRHLSAERSELPDHAVDLVTAANAVHWFDMPRFFAEAQRVLRSNGIIAVWCYSGLHTNDPRTDAAIQELALLVRPYWPAPIELVHNQYRTLEFPFDDIKVPGLCLTVDWTIKHFIGYVSTWSASQAYRAAEERDPIEQWSARNLDLLSETDKLYRFNFPLHLRVGSARKARKYRNLRR